jgi:hypothetical protein
MNIQKKIFGYIIACAIVVSPVVYALPADAAGLVPDCGKITQKAQLNPKLDDKKQVVRDSSGNAVYDTANPVKDKSGNIVYDRVIEAPCDFNYLMTLINNIINFLLFYMATPLVVIILCYAGFNLITSGGSSESITKAKHMIKNVIVGYIIALVAWLIVHAILKAVGFTGPMYLIQ